MEHAWKESVKSPKMANQQSKKERFTELFSEADGIPWKRAYIILIGRLRSRSSSPGYMPHSSAEYYSGAIFPSKKGLLISSELLEICNRISDNKVQRRLKYECPREHFPLHRGGRDCAAT